MTIVRNRELAQFASYLEVDQNGFIGIATTAGNRVGVGTTNPVVKFEIVGDTQITSGNLNIIGSATISSPVILKSSKAFTGIYTAADAGALVVSGASVFQAPAYFTERTTFLGIGSYYGSSNEFFGVLDAKSDLLAGRNLSVVGISTFNDPVSILTSEQSDDPLTGALTVDGGLGVRRNLNVGGITSVARFIATDVGTFKTSFAVEGYFDAFDSVNLRNNVRIAGIATIENRLFLPDGTDANFGVTEGALVVSGGVGIAKKLQVGGATSIFGATRLESTLDVLGNANLKGSVVSIGDTGSNIVTPGTFISNLVPNVTETYDVGTNDFRWNNIRGRSGVFRLLDASEGLTALGNITLGGNLVITSGMFVNGITTFVNGFISSATAYLQNLDVSGSTFLRGPTVGTISTATRAQTIDVTSTSTNSNFYLGFVDTSSTGEARTNYVDSGLSYNPSTQDLTIQGDLVVNGGDIRTSGILPALDFFNTNVVSARLLGQTQSILMGNTVGVATFRNPLNVFSGNIRVVGNGSTSAIQAADGTENITITSNTLTELSGDLAINGDEIIVKNGTLYFADQNVVNAYLLRTASAIIIGQNVGFTSFRSPLVVFDGDIRVNGNDIRASDNIVNISMESGTKTTFAGDIQINNNRILATDGNVNITLNSNLNTTFEGDIIVKGNDIRASDGNINITMTSNTLTSITGDLRVEGNDIQDGAGTVNMTLGTNFVTFAGDIKIMGNDIRASDGPVNITMISNLETEFAGEIRIGGDVIQASDQTQAITLLPGSGTVGFRSDIRVGNDLVVKGYNTILKTQNVKIKDKLIDIGFVNDPGDENSLIAPTTDENKDVGLFFNYYDTQARKAAIYWDDSESRIVIAAKAAESAGIVTVTSASNYAAVELNALYVNDCAGQSQVISCSSGTRTLANITIDGGIY